MNRTIHKIAASVGALVIAGGLAVTSAPSASAITYNAYVVKQNGPGLKNWRCIDPGDRWYGPWRYSKAGAVIDCASYNTRP